MADGENFDALIDDDSEAGNVYSIGDNACQPSTQKKAGKSKQKTRKWTTNEIDRLLDLFQERACLWDIFEKDYHSRDVKERAYNEMKDILGISVKEIKAKLISLRAQLGREIAKTNNKKSGQSLSENYTSTWVHWERLQFLHPVMNAGKSRDNLQIPQSKNVDSSSVLPDDSLDESVVTALDLESLASSCSTSSSSYRTPMMMRAQTEERKKELLSTCIQVLKEPTLSANSAGQCSFTMYVADKLKKLDARTRIIAEKRIHDILFEMEMNEMQAPPSQQTLNFPMPTNSDQNVRTYFSDEVHNGLSVQYLQNAVQFRG